MIDESKLRRGQDTANALWGNDASVLVGDFLFARAFELMVETDDIVVLGKLAGASAQITEGEIHQMLIAGKPDTAIGDYLKVVVGKTAELFATAAETGAMVAGADTATARIMHDYGMALGIAFQIADDALDYRADQAVLGKSVGDDFMEGKTTLPVMIAFEGDVVIVLESERQRWTETVGIDDSLSRVLVTTAVSVLTDREWLAHAAPPRAPSRGASATRTPKKASRAF